MEEGFNLIEFIEHGTLYLSTLIEAVAALLIAAAILGALYKLAAAAARRGATHSVKENVRLDLGRSLALALEFLVAADILQTAVAPTWNEIGQLAAIVVLRTVLNYFLERDIEIAARTRGESTTQATNESRIDLSPNA